MSFKSFLSAVGHDAGAVFNWLASSKGQATVATVEGSATAIATAVNPAFGLALTGFEGLLNAGIRAVVGLEQTSVAAAAQSGTGLQKASAVATNVAPQVASILQTLGITNPTAEQVQAIATVVASSLANIANAFPAPATTTPPAA